MPNKFICLRFCFNFLSLIVCPSCPASRILDTVFGNGVSGVCVCGVGAAVFGNAPLMYNSEIIKMKINSDQINFFVVSRERISRFRVVCTTFECQNAAQPMIYTFQVKFEARKMNWNDREAEERKNCEAAARDKDTALAHTRTHAPPKQPKDHQRQLARSEMGPTEPCMSCTLHEMRTLPIFMVVWSNISHGDKLQNDITLCKFMCLPLRDARCSVRLHCELRL